MSLAEVLEDSKEVDAQAFLSLTEEVRKLHEEEREEESMGIADVRGGLVTLPAEGRAFLLGDIHGDLDSLETMLEGIGEEMGREDFLVFLGDYGDRGAYSPEVYHAVLSIKEDRPDRTVLLRGNHEGPDDLRFRPYDLPGQFDRKFAGRGSEVHQEVRDLWGTFYDAVWVRDRYVVLHGGVPTEASSVEEVARASETHPETPHLTEMLWNDPMEGLEGRSRSPRGVGWQFGSDVTADFLELFSAKVLIRAHQVVRGVETAHDGRVLTLFSCKGPYGLDRAAYLEIDLDSSLTANELSAQASMF